MGINSVGRGSVAACGFTSHLELMNGCSLWYVSSLSFSKWWDISSLTLIATATGETIHSESVICDTYWKGAFHENGLKHLDASA
jgi:hypothetical protein